MNKRIPIGIGLILLIVALWALITPAKTVRSVIERINHIGYDIQLRSRVYSSQMKPSGTVVIVDIDDKSLKAEGRWPWPRSKLAQLVDKLRDNGAAVIAFDIFFPESEIGVDQRLEEILQQNNVSINFIKPLLQKYAPLFDEDEVLAKSIANSPSVLSFSLLLRKETQNDLPPPILLLTKEQLSELNIFHAPGYVSNIPIIQNAAKATGFINVFPDEDGIVRRVPLLLQYGERIYPGLALRAYLAFLDAKMELYTPSYNDRIILEGVKVGTKIIPTDNKGLALIPFVGHSYTLPYYSAIDVLQGKLPADALLGKVVFIGTSATGLGDLQPTSIQSPYPGVEIQASLVDGMIRNDFSSTPSWTLGATVTITLILGLIAVFVFPRLTPKKLLVVFIVFPMAMLYLNNLFWSQTGLIISLLVPVLLIMALAIVNFSYGYLFETRRRDELKAMFGQYVPEAHIDEMLKTKGTFALHGEDREMTVMFSDICNFTTLAEKMNAVELVDLLNQYFTPMTEIIYKYVGTIDKYVGDMIIAFWGAPLADHDHSYHAIRAALEMQSCLSQLRRMEAMQKWPEIKMGIGINTGHMSVGDMGSRYRRNYTVMGDSVNLASRVEGLTRYYGVDIIVTESTQQSQPKFVYRKLDLVKVKGKHNAIAIYEVIGIESLVSSAVKQELEKYHQALELYLKQQWERSLQIFTQLHQTDPKKKIYSIYIERIQAFITNPPPAEWDGVFVHKEK